MDTFEYDPSLSGTSITLLNSKAEIQTALVEMSAEFEKKVGQFARTNLQQMAESESEKLARIKQEIRQKFEGMEVDLTPEELRFAIYSGRRAVDLKTVAIVQAGTVAEVLKVRSGQPIESRYVMIDGLDLPEPGEWSAFMSAAPT